MKLTRIADDAPRVIPPVASAFQILVCMGLIVAAAAAGATAQTTPHDPDKEPRVTVVTAECNQGAAEQPWEAELGDIIEVDIDRLRPWVDAGGNPRALVLLLDSIPVAGITPTSVRDNRDGTYTLKFQLLHTVENQQTWATLFTSCTSPLPLSVGMPNGAAFAAAPTATLRLVRYRSRYMAGAITAFVMLIVLFVFLAWEFPLLRDTDTNQKGQKRPWSLARCQLALWALTILGSWIVLLVVTKHAGVLPASVLGLLGISAATAVTGAAVDAGKRNANQTQLQQLQTQRVSDATTLAALPVAAAPTPQQAALSEKINQVGNQINVIKNSLDTTSSNFWIDILSDADGISFYRFQIFAWTLVLWGYFVWSLWWHIAMPDFSPQLLGLLGISSGTYLGFKFPETKS